jgi:hypothetical protein
MQPSKATQNDPGMNQEVRVRYLDAMGVCHEERIPVLNLAAFILHSVKPISTYKVSEEMRDFN